MFYEDFKPNPKLSLTDVKKTFLRDSEQYRDACVRYTSSCGTIQVVYNMFYKTLSFTRRIYPEKDSDGKYVIDCDKHSVNRDVQLSTKELQFCSQCGKHKMYHSLLSPCKFTEPNGRNSFRQVDLPEWLPEDAVVFKNRRNTDRVVFASPNVVSIPDAKPVRTCHESTPSLELNCVVKESDYHA